MPLVAIALNIVFSAAVLILIVGGLTRASLTSTGARDPVRAPRPQAAPEPSARPSAGSGRDRGPAVAV